MSSFGPLAFANPLLLVALLALPLLWWLLRVTPPSPKRVRFPAIRLLLNLDPDAETAAHTPLWLLLLRLTAAALIIIGLANPFWRPSAEEQTSGPLLLLIDNGWASAANWDTVLSAAEDHISQAGRTNRRIAVLGTAPQPTRPQLQYTNAEDALGHLRALPRVALFPDRLGTAELISDLPEPPTQIIWIADGLDHGAAMTAVTALSETGAAIDLVEPAPSALATMLLPPQSGEQALTLKFARATPATAARGDLIAYTREGTPIARAAYHYNEGATTTQVTFDLPLQLRNEITRVSTARNNTAGSTILLDERWRRRTLGIVTGDNQSSEQPLLSDLYYLERALAPFVEVRKPKAVTDDSSPITDVLSTPLSLLLLADTGVLSGEDLDKVTAWIEQGGVLVRFAGPLLASQSDPLLPVPLRTGGREIGGALSWTEPQRLAAFPETSPFFGLTPPSDVLIHRQVLADPRSDLSNHVWARLQDGTPLVTARRMESGWTVLVHVTANADWSNLALSGLYVDMLRRLIELSHGTIAADTVSTAQAPLPPRLTLNGSGALVPPPPWVGAMPAGNDTPLVPTPKLLPGLYGAEGAARALNLTTSETILTALPALPGLTSRQTLSGNEETALKGIALTFALILLLIDAFAALHATGRLTGAATKAARGTPIALAILTTLLALTVSPTVLLAQTQEGEAERDAIALASVLETHLAYVLTGDARIDSVSEMGLTSLSRELERRTSLEPGAPVGVNIEQDELAFFPILYWPLSDNQPHLSDAALTRLQAYMQNGGTILFDTQDQNQTIRGLPSANQRALRNLLERVDVPILEPVPEGHVLTKAFYLLDDFPGRWEGGPVWVEAPRSSATSGSGDNDGVSAIIIGSNDYAAAWASDEAGKPQFAAVPGGERQREIATRVGINLIMYALTGNYKADQVHVPALLERLGQ